MHRRNFIRTSCSLCALAGSGGLLNLISSCTATSVFKTEITDNKIKVPVVLFAENSLQIIRPRNYEYDIALRKEGESKYSALQLRCTHADNALVSTGSGFQCNLHGSRFDSLGEVTKGPAEHALMKFKTEVTADEVIIILT
jgi:Rieske Fe-S protein